MEYFNVRPRTSRRCCHACCDTVCAGTDTVHLGPPNADAANVTLPFTDYVKNVASSEIYPTWDESALRANILAIVSFALNRVYTEYYRSRGYSFDITNSTAYDQAFVNGRNTFENIDAIVDDLAWLGLAADGPTPPVYQSDRSEIYQRYFDELSRRGLVYPCFCSRSQLHAASAPHRSDGQVIYAGTCRGLTPAEIAERSKIRAPPGACRCPTRSSPLRTATWGTMKKTSPATAGIFSCGGPTVCLPTSWPSLWTTR